WDARGRLLARAAVKHESASGWQEAAFDTPVAIEANTSYVASYFSPRGAYAFAAGAFEKEVSNPPLHMPATTDAAPNGLFTYTAIPAFPRSSNKGMGYWVDVVFDAASHIGSAAEQAIPVTASKRAVVPLPPGTGPGGPIAVIASDTHAFS